MTDRKKVLIADDQNSLRKLVCATLEGEGFALLEASDGTSALALARAERPTVALIDVQMPGLDGLAVCRAIKEDALLRDTTVILLTANAQAADRQRGVDAGADGYLTKPFSPIELLGLVERVMHVTSEAA